VRKFIKEHRDQFNDILIAAQFLEIEEITKGFAIFIGEEISAVPKSATMKNRFKLVGHMEESERNSVKAVLNWAE
jgi:hypothetical protein